MTTTATATTQAPRTTAVSNCSQGGNRSNYKTVTSNAATKPNGTLPGRWQDNEETRGRRRKGTKKAHRMSSMSLWPIGRFFSFLAHFIFILLTKLFLSTTLSYWWQWQQQQNDPHPSPVSHLLTGWIVGTTKQWGEEKWREEEDETMGEGKQNDGEAINAIARQTKQQQGKQNDRGWWHDNDEGITPPTSSLMSNCSWGGSWVEWQQWWWVVTRSRAKGWRRWINNDGRGYDKQQWGITGPNNDYSFSFFVWNIHS